MAGNHGRLALPRSYDDAQARHTFLGLVAHAQGCVLTVNRVN